MLTASSGLLRDLHARINLLSRNPVQSIAQTEKIIQYINSVIQSLKQLIKEHEFKDAAEEITFYKTVNPEFYALWLYYSTIHRILCHILPGSNKFRMEYLEHELRKIDDFFVHHLNFYTYLKAGRTYMDDLYFTRQGQAELNTELYAAFIDHGYCTSYSITVAMILANERLKVYLTQAIEDATTDSKRKDDVVAGTETLQWTESKTGLYEVIYHLYAGKVFNNGDATLEAITRYIEKVFFIELKSHTVSFQEILRRKKGVTYYWDQLKNKYLLYIEAVEERNRQRRTRR